MITGLNSLERQQLRELREQRMDVMVIVARVCEEKAKVAREGCARSMAHIPRDPETAANYAAHAEVYDRFLRELLEEPLEDF